MDLLQECSQCFDGLSRVRKSRIENRNFRMGNQFSGKQLKEIMKVLGEVPVQNLCSVLIRNLIGQFWSNKSTPIAIARKPDAIEESKMITLALERVIGLTDDLRNDAQLLEELILTGVACSKATYGWNEELDREEVGIRNVQFARLFFNPNIESGYRDITLIGEIYDVSLNQIVKNFAKTQQDVEAIKRIYGRSYDYMTIQQDASNSDNIAFYSSIVGMCRY